MDNGLERFLIAQQTYYRIALQEIKSGKKRSHWMWFIFPQVAGLGYSETARYYAIKDMGKAKAYMEDYTLFALAKPECEVFQKVLDKFFHGEKD